MSTDAIAGLGHILERSTDSGSTWTQIAEITGIGVTGQSTEIFDASDMSSSGIDKKLGRIDEGQNEISVLFLPDNNGHQDIEDDRQSKALRRFRVTHPDAGATSREFNAFVTAFPFNAQVGELLTGTFTLEVTGIVQHNRS